MQTNDPWLLDLDHRAIGAGELVELLVDRIAESPGTLLAAWGEDC
jgi:hypothetical protein